MAKTKEISYSYGRTINTGDFHSSRVDVSEVVELSEGDDRAAEFQELRSRVIKRLIDDVRIIQNSKKGDETKSAHSAHAGMVRIPAGTSGGAGGPE